MDNASQLLNWGFTASGTALGSEGSPSMPLNEVSGLGDPMETTANMLASFTEQTARRYGDVSDANGGIWDPRGDRALSSEVADYRTSDMLRPDEIAVQLNSSDDQLGGGDPVLASYIPDSSASAQALYDAGIGLSADGASTLADSLQSYSQQILNTIYLPRQVEPQVTNSLGLSTASGGLPQAFFDPSSGGIKTGMPEAISRIIANSAEYQRVDENGIVDKYAPGTDPYTAFAMGRLPAGSGPVAKSRPTPAQLRANPRLMLSPAAAAKSGLSSSNSLGSGGVGDGLDGGSGALSSNNTSGGASGGGGSFGGSSGLSNSSSGPVAPAAAGIPVPVNEGATSSSGLGASDYSYGYSYDSVDTSGGGFAGGEGDPDNPSNAKKPWWLLLVAAVGAGGIYLATRGKKKRGRR